MKEEIKTIEWVDDHARLIDQTKIPHEIVFVDCYKWQDIFDAIQTMQVRGAPAIGVAGAYGVVLGAMGIKDKTDKSVFMDKLAKISKDLIDCRPTAVNLAWAINRMMDKAEEIKGQDISRIIEILTKEAIEINREDLELCHRIGEYGEKIVPAKANILTHCNAGGLATAGYGTALGVIKSAFLAGKQIHVWVDETRPLLQGARLTAWELMQYGIPCTLITDNMAGYFINKGEVDLIVTGADRIAANGDTANKIGTYSLAVIAKENNVPFYIAAPFSTIDLNTPTGREIVVENRKFDEVTHVRCKQICPDMMKVANPAFDVTPNKYIKGIITDKGIIYPPYDENIKKIF